MLMVLALAAVAFCRVPEGGLQPQTAVDSQGQVHLIFFKGAPRAGDLFYAVGRDQTFSTPRRVNTHPGSAIAVGTIRGAQLALGRGNRVHVIWNGGPESPSGRHAGAGLFYTRLNSESETFEPERDLIERAAGLDGGSAVTADDEGRVYVVWHAPGLGQRDEAGRTIYFRRSPDNGDQFEPEQAVAELQTGVCACCGIRALSFGKDQLAVLYRQAQRQVERDMVLLTIAEGLNKTVSMEPWQTATCPMSSCSLTRTPEGLLAAWETRGQVQWRRLETEQLGPSITPAGSGSRKHPVLARNPNGAVLLVWTEDTGWNRGGAVSWQVFDSAGRPTPEQGRREGVPAWGLATAWAGPDGNFTVMY